MDKMRSRSSKIGIIILSRPKVEEAERLQAPPMTTTTEVKNKRSTGSSNRNATISTGLAVLLFIVYVYVTSYEYHVTPQRIADWSWNKTIIITGANSVVSFGVLTHLVRADTANHIVMTCRSVDRCQATLNQVKEEVGAMVHTPSRTRISIVPLDLASRESIKACARWIQSSQPILSTGSASPKTTILVWNANDSVHDPIAVNGWGHLYLTHLLYPQLQRIVIAASVVGGWPWNVLQPSWKQENHYPSWLQGVAQYGTSKRTMLFLAQQLLQQQKSLQVIATQAGLTCDATDACSAISMTPQKGAHSHLRAMLDPNLESGTYLGHCWVLWGKTVIAGSLAHSWYHWPLSQETQKRLWAWSMKELAIEEFGKLSTKLE
jgi:NAD(P)-dependent dehydrogenase (short-subunit alcohol dehydrogenase family)